MLWSLLQNKFKQIVCPIRSCVTSNKTFNAQTNAIEDHFELDCYGNADDSLFVYNVTSIPGYFVGLAYNRLFDGLYFPNTIVAKGNDITSNVTNEAQYEWVIEFQCRESEEFGVSTVDFIGINFYVSVNDPSQSLIDNMFDVAYEQGLGVYLNKSNTFVNQTDCVYPWS